MYSYRSVVDEKNKCQNVSGGEYEDSNSGFKILNQELFKDEEIGEISTKIFIC